MKMIPEAVAEKISALIGELLDTNEKLREVKTLYPKVTLSDQANIIKEMDDYVEHIEDIKSQLSNMGITI